MVVLNSDVTIETRTGIVLSSVPIASPLGETFGGINDAFDPRVLFDRARQPLDHFSSGANAESATAYILVGSIADQRPNPWPGISTK